MAPRKRSRKAAGKKLKQEVKSMGDNPEDCPVCLMAFDDTVQRPRNLPCGHTFCTVCINGLKEQDQVTCPTCRAVHAVPESGHFPISFTLEAIIRRLKDIEMMGGSSSSGAKKSAGKKGKADEREVAGLSRSMQSLLQEQEAKVLVTITACKEVQSQLDHYQTTLVDWHDQQQQFEDKLQGMIDESRKARVLVRQEESQVVAKKEEVQQGEQRLHDVLETLRKVNKEHEAGVIVVDVVRCTDEAEQRVEECREMFPDVHTVTMARKVREASCAAVETYKTVRATLETTCIPADAAGDKCSLLADPVSSVKDRLHLLLPPTLKPKDLCSLKQSARDLLAARRVFAVHQVEEQFRYAKISLEDDRLYLHSLRDQPPPLGATAVQLSEVVLDVFPCVVFLDLMWPSSSPRRILIRLNPDTPLGRQFVLLCTGQRGPSYANTRLWRVWNKGEPGECVWGGDYERNDGTGGAALLPDLGVGKYRRSHRLGTVWGRVCSNPAQGAQFAILTTDRLCGDVFGDVFGEVIRGVNVVAAAALHSDIRQVTVVNCGMVL